MLIRRPETLSWKQPNPMLSDPAPKWGLKPGTGGVVGHKSIILNSPGNLNVKTAPVAITSPRPAGCRKESYWCDHMIKSCKEEVVFYCSSAGTSNKEIMVSEVDFLCYCSLFRKQLLGKDVYIYQGKAFCCMECRYQQMVSDEVQEKCWQRTKMF